MAWLGFGLAGRGVSVRGKNVDSQTYTVLLLLDRSATNQRVAKMKQGRVCGKTEFEEGLPLLAAVCCVCK